MAETTIDGDDYREVLGRYPTGVTVITASTGDGPIAMVIGSFVSVSLDPPLVGFLPTTSSTSWQTIEPTGSFCVNVLGDDQLELCNAFFRKEEDVWDGCEWDPAPSGSPRILDAVAWIDCSIERVVAAGDHVMVFGLVGAMGVGTGESPLVFLGGRYGSFTELGS